MSRTPDYAGRLSTLFPDEMAEIAPLAALTETVNRYYEPSSQITMPRAARAALKQRLIAAHEAQQHAAQQRQRWQWAALGASVTVAGALAARAWRGQAARTE
ncbi:MAG: hypothetical protein KDD73_14740 [Anaerolineales bacterium]|nr:hypothetical protein [Anaerolineales bacterium]